MEIINSTTNYLSGSAARTGIQQQQGAEVVPVLVLEGEVHRLAGEVTIHVSQVASPEGQQALVPIYTQHAVYWIAVLDA